MPEFHLPVDTNEDVISDERLFRRRLVRFLRGP